MRKLTDITLDDLGRAHRATITRSNTTIVGGRGNPEQISARIQTLRQNISSAISQFDREKLRERLARLAGAIVFIESRGLTQAEQIDSKYRIESAVYSCQSAVDNGYALGGGVSYLNARTLVDKLIASDESERLGISAVSHALELPIRQLIKNSHPINNLKLFNEVENRGSDREGFNAENGKVEDLLNVGVLDSANSLKLALTLGFSYAKDILTTGAWDTGAPAKTETGGPRIIGSIPARTTS
jgi:chaperonin GroEL